MKSVNAAAKIINSFLLVLCICSCHTEMILAWSSPSVQRPTTTEHTQTVIRREWESHVTCKRCYIKYHDTCLQTHNRSQLLAEFQTPSPKQLMYHVLTVYMLFGRRLVTLNQPSSRWCDPESVKCREPESVFSRLTSVVRMFVYLNQTKINH